MVILEYFRLSNIKMMVIMYYLELKVYGIEINFVENVSMEFDVEMFSFMYCFM